MNDRKSLKFPPHIKGIAVAVAPSSPSACPSLIAADETAKLTKALTAFGMRLQSSSQMAEVYTKRRSINIASGIDADTKNCLLADRCVSVCALYWDVRRLIRDSGLSAAYSILHATLSGCQQVLTVLLQSFHVKTHNTIIFIIITHRCDSIWLDGVHLDTTHHA